MQKPMLDLEPASIPKARVGRPRVSGIGQTKNPYKWVRAEQRREKERERTARRYARRKQWFIDFKQSLSCQLCGHQNDAALDFHHIDPMGKKFSPALSSLVRSRKSFMDELSKCACVCTNCHRAIHNSDQPVSLYPIDLAAIPPMPN